MLFHNILSYFAVARALNKHIDDNSVYQDITFELTAYEEGKIP